MYAYISSILAIHLIHSSSSICSFMNIVTGALENVFGLFSYPTRHPMTDAAHGYVDGSNFERNSLDTVLRPECFPMSISQISNLPPRTTDSSSAKVGTSSWMPTNVPSGLGHKCEFGQLHHEENQPQHSPPVVQNVHYPKRQRLDVQAQRMPAQVDPPRKMRIKPPPFRTKSQNQALAYWITILVIEAFDPELMGEKPKSPAVGEADSSSVDANAHGTVTTTVAADSATATSSAPSPFGTTSMSLNEPESAAVAVPNPSSTTQPASNPAATSTSAPPRGHQSFSIGSIKGIDDEGLQSAAEVLGWMELTAEEIQIRRTGFQNLRGKLQTWFATQVRKVGETGSALITKMAEASGRVAPKPQRMHDVQMFIRVYYNDYIKEALQIEMERLQEEFQQWRTANPNASNEDVKKKKPVRVGVQTALAKRILAEQSEEFRKEISELADKELDRRTVEWKDHKKAGKDAKTKTAEEWAASLQQWGPEASKMTAAIGEEIGMPGVTAFVGPNPLSMGDIDLYLTSVGKTPSGLSWPQYDPEAYKVFRNSMISFAKHIFPHKARAARSIQQQLGPLDKVWGSGDASALNEDADGPQSSSESENERPRRKPGPGRNSHGVRVRKTQEERGGKKQKRSGDDTGEKDGKKSRKGVPKNKPAAKSKAVVSSDDESSDEVPIKQSVKPSKTPTSKKPLEKATTSKKGLTSDTPAKKTRASDKPSTKASTSTKTPAPSKKSVASAKPSIPTPTQPTPQPRPKPRPITRTPNTTSETPAPPKPNTTAAPAIPKPSAYTSKKSSEIVPPTPTDIASPAESDNDTPVVNPDIPSAGATGIAMPVAPAKPDAPVACPAGTSTPAAPGIDIRAAEAEFLAAQRHPLVDSSGIAIPTAQDDMRAAEAEAWKYVHLYACNPDGNMAQLHSKLQSILGESYEAESWNPVIQSATDEDGDTKRAAAQVRSMAPPFVIFNDAPKTNETDKDQGVNEDKGDKTSHDVQHNDNEGDGKDQGQDENEDQDKDEDEDEGEASSEDKDEDEDEDKGEDKGEDKDDDDNDDDNEIDELIYDDTKEISSWNHPGSVFWRPWVKDSVHRWWQVLQEYEVDMSDGWVTTFEEMIEVWLRLEEVRGYEEYAGRIESSKEPGWIGEWRADEVRHAVWPGKWNWGELKEALKDVEQWWRDIRPERDLEKERKGKGKKKQAENEEFDWAPLDRTSGLDGFWMFLVAMISIMIQHHENEGPMFEMLGWQAEWQLLGEDMVKVMKQVVDDGVEALHEEIACVEVPKRTTRGQKRKLEEHGKDKEEPKAKKAQGKKTLAETDPPAARETRSKTAAKAGGGKPQRRKR
ncbi:hypothetical protein VKT23_012152 [Stygiomarasmius scandens]|uniref:Uncharacterized protein n=1 Tax=Marasmiellus scandens TaxID=2682957 RepID=A0ABR1JB33_9AGAR